MRHTQRETQAEGEAGSMQGARRGTRSWVSRIMTWAEIKNQILNDWATQVPLWAVFWVHELATTDPRKDTVVLKTFPT